MRYKCEDGLTSYKDEKQNDIIIANFVALIEEEHIFIDGNNLQRFYVLTGVSSEGEKFVEVSISSEEFLSMRWVSNAWGSRAIIYPKSNSKEFLRTIIQLESKPVLKTIYTHTGWIEIDEGMTYLTNGCAISKDGRTKKLELNLPPDLKCYKLPLKKEYVTEGINASIMLRKLAPPEVSWMLLAAVYRAPLGKSDFSCHITGRTGTYKSEFAALMQSHYGATDARNLPANWSSTANALEALAYKAKDALIVVDDFIPQGTSWQVKAYQKTADQLIRGQGNQAGRARLTDTSRMQETMYPRGLILSTGEDTPEGHSVRGRMMIAELSPGDIKTTNLTKAQDQRMLYQHGFAEYIAWLSKDLEKYKKEAKVVAKSIRDENMHLGHARTPPTLGELASGVWMFLQFAVENGLSVKSSNKLFTEAVEALRVLAGRQNEYLVAADPAEQFIQILRGIFAACAGHANAIHGGIPKKALLLGWTMIGDEGDEEFKPHGPRLGWADSTNETLYLDAAVAYDTIRRHSRGTVTITRQTLYRRLKEAGYLTKSDPSRQRNTIRINAEKAGRTCLALSLPLITEGTTDE